MWVLFFRSRLNFLVAKSLVLSETLKKNACCVQMRVVEETKNRPDAETLTREKNAEPQNQTMLWIFAASSRTY